MKRTLSLLLAALTALSLAACAAPAAGPEATAPAAEATAAPQQTPAAESGARTVTAQKPGFGGDVSVTLTVENGKIIDASVTGESETEGIGSRAVEQLPAALIEAGTPEIDGI